MQWLGQLIARRSDLVNVGDLQCRPSSGIAVAVKSLEGEARTSTDLFSKSGVVPKIGSGNPKHVDVS
jgi:hypothetical protein